MSTHSTGSNTTRNWVIRLVSLYIFSFVAFLLLGFINSSFSNGFFHLFWSALIFTLATVFVKPIVSSFAQKTAEGLKQGKTSTAARVIEYVAVFAVALVIWLILSVLGAAQNPHWFSWILSPVLLLVAWAIYDVVDEKIEAQVAKGYDAATRKRDGI